MGAFGPLCLRGNSRELTAKKRTPPPERVTTVGGGQHYCIPLKTDGTMMPLGL